MADTTEDKNNEGSKQVSYNIDLSIPSIIAALHQKAIGSAEKKAKDIRIANSAIESDGKTVKLKSAGLHIISVLATKEGNGVKKSDAIVALQEYVNWFVGPDLGKKVTDKVVLPLANGEKSEEQTSETNNDDKENNNDKEKEQTEENPPKNESIKVKSFGEFLIENCGLKFLFEAGDPSLAGEDPDGPDQEDIDLLNDASDAKADEENLNNEEKKEEENKLDKKDEDDKNPSALGWYIAYNLKVQGLKETALKDAMKQFATTFFDNLTIKSSGLFGGGEEYTGKQLRKGLHDLMHVDHEKLAENVDEYIKKKFPNIESSEVHTRDKNTLLRELKTYLSPDQKELINNADYSLWIKIKEEDRKKPFMNTLKIADVIRKCMSFFRIGKKANITKDKIIKIEDFKDQNDPLSIKNNAKRPSASVIEALIKNKEYNPDKKGKIEYLKALKLYNEIVKKFEGIEKDKKASQEKENKDALAILSKLKDLWKKQKEDVPVEKKIFEDFYKEYLKFESSTNESISFSFISKKDIGNMILEMLFEDVEMNPQLVFEADSKTENGEDDKKEEVPNYNELSSILKKAAILLKGTKYTTAVLGKDNAIYCLKNSDYDVSSILNDNHKNFAIIDFHPNSIIEDKIGESIENKIVNMLFEAGDPSLAGEDPDGPDQEDIDLLNDASDSEADVNGNSDQKQKLEDKSKEEPKEEPKDRISARIETIFKDFKKKANITDEQSGKTIILEVEIENENKNESAINYSPANLLTEAKDLVSLVENDLGTNATKLGKTAMKQKGLHNTYPMKVGTSDEVIEYLKKLKVGNNADFEKMKLKKYSAALVVKQNKEENDVSYNGAHGNAAFTDEAVKSECFQKSFDDSNNFEYLVISGTTPASKETHMQYNKDGKYKVPVDIKVFIASFDENVKEEVNTDKPKPEPEPEPELKKTNKVKAYVLPFDINNAEKAPEDENPQPEPEPGEEPDEENGQGSEGTDLYIYPIESAKDFEEGKNVNDN